MIRGSFLNGNNQLQDYDLSKLIEAFRTQGVVTGMNVTTNAVNTGYGFITVTRGTQTWLMLVEIQSTEVISTSGTKKVRIDIDQTKVDSPSSNPIDGSTIARIQTGASYPGSGNFIKLASITSGTITDERDLSSFTLLATLAGSYTLAGLVTFGQFPVTPSSAPTTNYQVANKKYVDDQVNAGFSLNKARTILSITRDRGAASATVTYTHGLGRTPNHISITGFMFAAPTYRSEGYYDSTNHFCMYVDGSNGHSTTSYDVDINYTGGDGQKGLIQNITSTTFDIVRTRAGATSGTNIACIAVIS